MNYIKQLQEENAAKEKQLAEIQENINCFLTYLNSPKFQGADKNWICATEVVDKLREMRMLTLS